MDFTSAIRSNSLRLDVAFIYASTAAFCSAVVIFETNSCSGANVIKLTPKTVSGRVVKTSISYPKSSKTVAVSLFSTFLNVGNCNAASILWTTVPTFSKTSSNAT